MDCDQKVSTDHWRGLFYAKFKQWFTFSFDLFTKFFIVIAIWWLMFTLSLLQITAFKYIGMVFNLIQGPLIFCVAMCRTRVAFLFKKYFCEDICCFKCFKSDEFIGKNIIYLLVNFLEKEQKKFLIFQIIEKFNSSYLFLSI